MDQNIILEDDYQIFDRLIGQRQKIKSGPLGWVQVYFDNKLHHAGPNLVIDQGRQFVNQKVFQSITKDGGGSLTDRTTYVLDSFAVGSGGVTFGSGGNFTINGPTPCDTYLTQAIDLGNTSYLNEPNTYNGGDSIHLSTYAVKPITTSGSVVLESNVCSGGATSYWTTTKCTCSVDVGEPSGLASGASVQISEAGLYYTNLSAAGTTAELFSHVCFAPKWKEKESSLSILWYILF